MDRKPLITRDGSPGEPGGFVRFLIPVGNAVAGPYRYEGIRDGKLYFSVAGIEFSLESVPQRAVEHLHWSEWKRPDFHLDRFLQYFYQQQSAVQAGSPSRL